MWYLDCSTKGNSLIRVDALGKLAPIEEVRKQALHLGDTGGATNQHNVMHCAFVNLGILQPSLIDSVITTVVTHITCT